MGFSNELSFSAAVGSLRPDTDRLPSDALCSRSIAASAFARAIATCTLHIVHSPSSLNEHDCRTASGREREPIWLAITPQCVPICAGLRRFAMTANRAGDLWASAIESALVDLTQNEGVTAAAVRRHDVLVDLGSKWAASSPSTTGASPSECVVELIHHCSLQLEHHDRKTLVVLLGIEVTGDNPTQRFHNAAANGIDRHSRRTVDEHKASALKNLVERIVELGDSLGLEGARARSSEQLSYVTDRLLNLTVLNADRSVAFAESTVWITGTADDTTPEWFSHGLYLSDPREGVIGIDTANLFGCHVLQSSWVGQYSFIRLGIDRSLSPGVRHVFRYRRPVKSATSVAPKIWVPAQTNIAVCDSVIDFGIHHPRRRCPVPC